MGFRLVATSSNRCLLTGCAVICLTLFFPKSSRRVYRPYITNCVSLMIPFSGAHARGTKTYPRRPKYKIFVKKTNINSITQTH